MRFGRRGQSECFFLRCSTENALTEIAWEEAAQGLGMVMSTVASVKNSELLFIGNVFYKQ